MLGWHALQQIAIDLTDSIGAADRYERLLAVVRSAIPCDATALLALRDGELVPLAVHGLSSQVLARRFRPAEHPRFRHILDSSRPVRFAAASELPDPFDGLVEGAPHALAHVHDCLGCPLVAGGVVVGVLTADALAVDAFDDLDDGFLMALGALAGAALHTARLLEQVETLAERRGMVVRELTRGGENPRSEMLGTSTAIERVRREIAAVATTDFPVLILGETGTGKELVAREIHAASDRREAPFIQVNCAALPEGVIESELFGHVRGAFTGAVANRPGKFEIADGGTLFLDEIGELPLGVQAKLLRVLQEGEVQRVGADRITRVDVRIITATNRELDREVARGQFRADLFHRLDVFPVRVPPLRERRSDITSLADYFLDRHRLRLGAPSASLTESAMKLLEASDWPGNVRELDHTVARAALRARMRTPSGMPIRVDACDIDAAPASKEPSRPAPLESSGSPLSLREALELRKRELVAAAFHGSRGNVAEAARRLGMDRSNLHHMVRRLGLVAR
ncbi:MAG: nitric oxide reductase transcriptional regulator NorR [Kofleriaceae bacterium]|nr:nitric oxide reductase transcriptional regulator NorR [Kofleriaceae bacterium]